MDVGNVHNTEDILNKNINSICEFIQADTNRIKFIYDKMHMTKMSKFRKIFKKLINDHPEIVIMLYKFVSQKNNGVKILNNKLLFITKKRSLKISRRITKLLIKKNDKYIKYFEQTDRNKITYNMLKKSIEFDADNVSYFKNLICEKFSDKYAELFLIAVAKKGELIRQIDTNLISNDEDKIAIATTALENTHRAEIHIKKIYDKPLIEYIFDVFKNVTIAYDNIMTCSICDDNQSDIVTCCGHQYCKECLLLWLAKNHNCPLCRSFVNEHNIKNIKCEKK